MEIFLFGPVVIIICYYIQTLCFEPKRKVVSVLPIVFIAIITSVVAIEYYQFFILGHDNFLFYNKNMFDILAVVLRLAACIVLIVGMVVGVALAWIVYVIRKYMAKKE